jgi:hypothetical protein
MNWTCNEAKGNKSSKSDYENEDKRGRGRPKKKMVGYN